MFAGWRIHNAGGDLGTTLHIDQITGAKQPHVAQVPGQHHQAVPLGLAVHAREEREIER